jgi:hypothetical protein
MRFYSSKNAVLRFPLETRVNQTKPNEIMSRLTGKDTRDTITIRLNSELKDEFQDAIDGSMSTNLREHIETIVETKQSRAISTNNHTLRQAYQIICTLSENYQSDILETDIVKTKLSSELNISKDAIKQGILQELEEHGLIKPLWGKIKVLDQQAQTQPDQQADQQQEQEA